jgi:hypothetical protein
MGNPGVCWTRLGDVTTVAKMPTEINQTYFAIEQCPPVGAWPDPAAMTGGSLRKSTVGEASQSHDKKPINATQKTILSTVMGERLGDEACSDAVMMPP